jgi:hypothetical protein
MPATNVFQALNTLLTTAPALAYLNGQIYFGLLPQQETAPVLPALSFFQVADHDEVSHGGRSGLGHVRIQFTCWALTATEAGALSRALKSTLSGFKGAVDGYTLGPIFFITGLLHREPGENLHKAIADYYVWNTD